MGTRTWEVTICNRSFKLKLAKARAEALAHRIKDATVYLPQHTRELSNHSDGTEYASTSMVLFGKGQANILDPDAWQTESAAALDKWAGTIITEANLTEAAAEFRAIYEKHVPVLDRRQSAEQRAAARREREEREAARQAADQAERAGYLAQFSNGADSAAVEIPAGKMAIVLKTTYDNSDSMTDYYDPHRSVGVPLLLAIVGKQAKTQALARMAVSRYPELAATSWEWHTENYSMGHGNYLQSGYVVEVADPRKPGDPRRCKYEVSFDPYGKSYAYKGYPGSAGQSAPAEASAPVSLGSGLTATIGRNTAKDGIEIRFSDRPADEVITRLKANRWRWSRFSKCWYTRYSPQAEAFAAELVKSLQPEPGTPPAPAETIAEESEAPLADNETTEAETDEEALTAEDMAAITGQEWNEEAMEQFRACC